MHVVKASEQRTHVRFPEQDCRVNSKVYLIHDIALNDSKSLKRVIMKMYRQEPNLVTEKTIPFYEMYLYTYNQSVKNHCCKTKTEEDTPSEKHKHIYTSIEKLEATLMHIGQFLH